MVAFQDLIVPLFSFILLVTFFNRRRSTVSPTPRKKLPPSPKKLPIIGNLHQIGKSPHRSLQALSKQYGELMLLHFGSVPMLVASSVEAAREIMKNQDVNFSHRPNLPIPRRLTYDGKDIGFAQYGEYWRQIRSICVVQLLSNSRVQSFRRVREEETSIMVEKIKRLGSSSGVVNLSDVLVKVTNDVVCRVALGRKYGEDEEGRKFQRFLSDFVELLGTPSMGDYIPWLSWLSKINGLDKRVDRTVKLFDEFLEGVLQEHRDQEKRAKVRGDAAVDFIDILLEFQRENKNSSPVEDDTVKALILDMFAAGTDTTLTTMEWTLAELIRHPRVMKILQKEVREVAGGKDEIDEDDLQKMPYLKAVMKEGVRLHSPAPLLIPRESGQDVKVLGYDVPAGTRVVTNVFAIQRDPKVWENPNEFYPERFLGSSIDIKGLHFELLPFGAGRRGCPGVTFAWAVNEIALAKLVQKFDFAMPNGERAMDLDMSEAIGLTCHKKFPILVLATPHTA